MIKKITLLLFLALLRQIAFAQKTETGYAGVYLTRENYVNHQLSCKINTGEKGYKLEFPPIADWALSIRIVTPDSVHLFKAGLVFGYYENGNVYRYAPQGNLYVAEDYYKVADNQGLTIYTSEFNSGDEYFYSATPASTIKRLNLKNIKQDFEKYPEFISAVNRLNNKEVHGDLAKKDANGNFMINKIYEQTMKK